LRDIARLPIRLRTASRLLRLCPAGMPGRMRVAKLLFGDGLKSRDISIQGHDGLRFLVPCLREPIALHLFVDGEYERETLRVLLRILAEGAIYVDVGANIGVFALPAARQVGAHGKVIGVEASPAVFPYLEHNVAANDLPNVFLYECALCDHDDLIAQFWEAPATKFGMGALAPQFEVEPVNVRTRTLDSVLSDLEIEHVDVLKVDVEGFEAGVFRGAQRLLSGPNPPIVIFEFCDWAEQRSGQGPGAAQRVIADYGYTLWRLKHFPNGAPLDGLVTEGSDMLVAAHRSVATVRDMTAAGRA
jgi:FkbM family methyltransferase